jgi:hypothetical protein
MLDRNVITLTLSWMGTKPLKIAAARYTNMLVDNLELHSAPFMNFEFAANN